MKRDILLGIETGVGGGSVSIFEAGKQIGFWTGDDRVSRSEDVLQAISDLFKVNKIKRSRLLHIYFSDNPGSFTGLRIGKSIVLGLVNALQVSFSITPVLPAMGILSSRKETSVSAVPSGRNSIAWMQTEFNGSCGVAAAQVDASSLKSGTIEDFIKFTSDQKHLEFIVHSKLYFLLRQTGMINLINAEKNLARIIIECQLARANASDNEIQSSIKR